MDERIEIVKYRANHAIVKVKLQMYPEDTSSSFLLAFFLQQILQDTAGC